MLIISWAIALIAIMIAGMWAGRALESSRQFTGADRSYGAIGVGCMLAAVQIGGMSMIGAAQNGYNIGIAGAWYSVSGCCYFFVMIACVKALYKKMPGVSLTQYLGMRYGKINARIYVVIYLVYAVLYVPIQLQTCVGVLQIVVPQLSYNVVALIALFLCVMYTGYRQMDGVQYYHIIQSFKPGEVTPELALEIAREFAAEHLSGYQAVIGVHVDKEHIHAHTIFNSVNADTGEKYHSNARSYYSQIRAISDRLCREHGLSIIMEGKGEKAVSYIEWLRQNKGQPTFRAMLEADLREAIEDANDIGHFFLIMEHKGYEIKHGARLGFRLKGQERFMIPGRKNPLFTEDGIRAAIAGNLDEIAASRRPAIIYRPRYEPYRRRHSQKYTGFMALYVHYLYLLGKIGRQQYPPKMTPHLRQEIMKFESYKEHFAFLRAHGVSTAEDLQAVRARTEETLASLMKQRTILNVWKKKRRALYDALSDAEALAPAKDCYESGMPGMEEPFARYMDAVSTLERCGIPKEQLMAEKAELYRQLADINREIRQARKEISLCETIERNRPQMEHDIHVAERQGRQQEMDLPPR